MATAVVAALVALVGVLVCEGALGLDMAAPPLLPIGSSFAVRLVSSVLSRTTRIAWAGEAHG